MTLNVGANSGGARTGTVSIAGHTFTVSQAATTCNYSISPSSFEAGSDSTTTTVSVTTGGSCGWTASSNNRSWLEVVSGASGTGNGSVRISIGGHSGTSPRTGTVTIAGHTFSVTQAAPLPCTYSLSPNSLSILATGTAGTPGTFSVSTRDACSWTAAAQVPWITVLSNPASNSGNGTVAFTVAENTGAARTGSIAVGDQAFTVSQAAAPPAPCSYSLSPASQNVTAAATTGSFAVTAGPTCGWSATANATWLTITSGASGTGAGSVGFAVAENTGDARVGTIVVAGQTFTVSQAAMACSYTLTPNAQSIAAAGESGSFAVGTGGTCTWSATSSATWLTITGAATGTGPGTVAFTAAENSGAARIGTISVGGQAFTVSQAAAACNFAIAPTGQSVAAGGGTGSVALTAGASCTWTAAAEAPWLSITSPTSGTGSATVSFSAAANTGEARTGILRIAGLPFTVTQEAVPCSYTLSATTLDVGAGAATGSVGVTTTTSACAWTAVSSVEWLTITGGASATGAGTVTFTVAANLGPARSGTMTIAGQTFTVNQSGL